MCDSRWALHSGARASYAVLLCRVCVSGVLGLVTLVVTYRTAFKRSQKNHLPYTLYTQQGLRLAWAHSAIDGHRPLWAS